MDNPLWHPGSVPRRHLTTTLATGSQALNKYSCVTCRSRKVKCNKIINGCINCTKAGIACVYSSRRTRKSYKAQQVPAIRPLAPREKRVADARSSRSSSPEYSPQSIFSPHGHGSDDDDDDDDDEEEDEEEEEEDVLVPREIHDRKFRSISDSNQIDQGRLYVAPGKSQYINGRKVNMVRSLFGIFNMVLLY